MKRYVYFISYYKYPTYANEGLGKGGLYHFEISREKRIKSIQDIKEIESEMGMATILNFQLLRTEKD